MFDPRRSWPPRALALAVLVSTLGPSAPARAVVLAPSSSSYGELMVEAAAKRDAGAHAESAALFGRAYRARPLAERADDVGENTIRAAMTDYDLASSAQPELVEAQAELLREFIDDRRALLAAPNRGRKLPEAPQDLVEELARLEALVAERRADQQAAAEAAAFQPEPEPEPEPAPAPAPTATVDRRPALALIGVGVASFAGGVALIGGGAWNRVQITERANARVAALDAEPRYTPEQRQAYGDTLDQWRGKWRTISTVVIAGGSVLAAAGIGLTAYGVLRLRRARTAGARAALVPALGPRELGLRLTIAY